MRRLRGLLLFLLGLIGAAQSVPADEIDDILDPAELAAGEVYRKQGGKSWGEIFGSYFAERPFARSFALIIGVNRYDSDWPQLDATRGDPARMRQLLVDQEGFDLVVTLENERATKERIDILMRDVFPGLLEPDDRFLFYFSGHGTQREIRGVGLTGYLPLTKSGRVYGRMISMAELREWDRGIAPVKQVLFLLDSCFSGIAGLQPMGEERNLGVERLADYGHHLVTAGTADEQTIAGGAWGGSIFTDSLLRGAQGSADSGSEIPRDGVVSLFELKDYVGKRVAAEALGEGWKKPIRPQLYSLSGDNKGEFFFVTRERKLEGRSQARLEQGMPVVPQGGSQKSQPALDPVEREAAVTGRTNIRAEPSAASARVATLDEGTQVYVAGKVSGQPWYLIERDGRPIGYVFERLLRFEASSNSEARVLQSDVAVPASVSERALPSSTEQVKVEPLGLTLSNITPELKSQYSIGDTAEGLVVTEVAPDSPAADESLRPGDLVAEVSQEPVTSPSEALTKVNQAKKDKKSVLLMIRRQDDIRFVALRFKE
jgi:hypothetical protein